MIEQTTLKSPGWQKVIAELSAYCPDDKTYLDRMLRIMARVSAARQGVLAVPAGGENQSEVRVLSIWPAPGAEGGGGPAGADANDRVATPTDATVIEYASDVRGAAWAALESGQSRVFAIESKTQFYDAAAGQGFILAIPLSGAAGISPGSNEANKPVAAITLLLEPRAKQAVQSTLAMAEVIGGYTSAHAARQQLRRTQSTSLALDLATRLIGAVNNSANFKGACLQLTNDLAKQLGADRAALGWAATDKIKCLAISDTEHFDRRMAMVQKIEAAMDECLDQEQPVVCPAPPADQDVLLSQAITQSHRELAAGNTALRIISVPLRDGDRTLGVVTMETTPPPGTPAGPIDLTAVELLQAAMDLVTPVLRIRRSDDRNLALRAADSAVKAGSWLVGVKHTVWKLAGVALIAATLFVSFYKTTYRVGADFALQPRIKQVISVPFDAIIRDIGISAESGKPVEAGSLIRKGDLLVQLDTTELELTASGARQKIQQAEKDMSRARVENKLADAQKAESAANEARANLEAAEERIRRSRIVSPIDGTILAGRLNDRIGSSVKLGEKFFEIAPVDDMIAVAKVDERDVSFIQKGTKGRLATRSHPGEKFDLVVESVVPLATAEEGKNTFEVRARIENPDPTWMRPGMEGIARLDAGEKRLIFIGTRRIIDAVRLWLW